MSSEPLFVYNFNTTYDLINLLNDTKYDFIFKKDTKIHKY